MPTYVKIFKGPIDVIEYTINAWVQTYQVQIVSSSLCYDEKAMAPGTVFAMVVYQPSLQQMAHNATPPSPHDLDLG